MGYNVSRIPSSTEMQALDVASKQCFAHQDEPNNALFDWCHNKWSDSAQPASAGEAGQLPGFQDIMFRSVEANGHQVHGMARLQGPSTETKPIYSSTLPDVKIEQRLPTTLPPPPTPPPPLVYVAPPPVIDDEYRPSYEPVSNSPARHAPREQQQQMRNFQYLQHERSQSLTNTQCMDKRSVPWFGDEDAHSSAEARTGDDTQSSNGISKKKRRINRPKHNHSKVATDILKQWFATHLTDPFPTDQEKQRLSEATQLSVTQISTWFINERKRVLKPLRLAILLG
jgi:hypothetical protein